MELTEVGVIALGTGFLLDKVISGVKNLNSKKISNNSVYVAEKVCEVRHSSLTKEISSLNNKVTKIYDILLEEKGKK